MKHIKDYNSFIILESFSTSREYNDFLKSKTLSMIEIMNDSLSEVKDFSSVNIYRYLIDSNGKVLNINIDDQKYRIYYNIYTI